VILAAASLGWDDSTTRNILIGGVVSLSSAAAAFYFASTNATEARRDLMQATATGMPVPDLHGKTIDQATVALRGTGLKLVVWDGEPASNGPITKQMPLGGTVISGSDSVVVRTT
jgi:hypothetical protein